MEQEQDKVFQSRLAIRTKPLLSLTGGALAVLCVAYSQVPASAGYLLTAVLAGLLCVGGGAYLLRRKPEWSWTIGLIPVFVHSMFGEDYYPYRSTGFIKQFAVYAQWLCVIMLTVTFMLACVVILRQHRNAGCGGLNAIHNQHNK